MKILAAGPYEVERIGIQSILQTLLATDVTVVHAASGIGIVEQLDRHVDIELVIVDVNIADRARIDRLAELTRRVPPLPIIVLDGGGGNMSLYACKINLAHAVEKAGPLALLVDTVPGWRPSGTPVSLPAGRRLTKHPR